ncbi:MAG: hypothetical protein ACRDI2_26635, partial [Chloroflexota bacterium]
LEIVKDPSIQKQATATADKLRAGIGEVFTRRGIDGAAGGEVSMVSISFRGPKPRGRDFQHKLRSAMQLGGVDSSGGLIVSAVHDDRDVAQTVEAFDQALAMLQAEELV